MKRMMAALLVATAGLLVSGCGWEQARFTRTDTLSEPHQVGSDLDVEVDNGSIEVKRGGEAVSVVATIKAVSQERLDATHVVVTRESDGTLNIRIDWPQGGRKGNEGCSLAIEMPDAGSLELVTSNGTVRVREVGSDATLRTSNGAINVASIAGRVDARTSNGVVEISHVSGDVYADSSNGRIELTDVGGRVSASTSNGDVTVRLNDASPGPVSVESSNGSVHVAVGSGFRGQLEGSTSNGGFRVEGFEGAQSVEVGKNWAKIRFDGEGTSRIRTSNGSVTLLRTVAP